MLAATVNLVRMKISLGGGGVAVNGDGGNDGNAEKNFERRRP